MNATPGPWIFVKGPEGATADFIIAEDFEGGDVVAAVMSVRSGTSEANARLIADAPHMYERLRLADQMAEAALAYDAAIQLAGRHGKSWVDSSGPDSSLDALYEDWIEKARAYLAGQGDQG
jgi:hypothetical protein